jgi:hypothetical protein
MANSRMPMLMDAIPAAVRDSCPEMAEPRREGQTVEGCASLRQAEHLLPDAHPQVARHRHAGTAVAHGVVDALVPSDVRERIERVGDETGPGMTDAGLAEFGKQARQLGAKLRAAHPRVGFACRDAAAEEDARPVR